MIYLSKNKIYFYEFAKYIKMQVINELGEAVAVKRRLLGLKQGEVAARAGLTQETLSRFERGRAPEFGSRKLLAVLAVLGMELQFIDTEAAGSLDELRRERGG
ncbi:helix-turn-helix domain-containing protein [Luteibacter sp. RCC_6_2]|uniref:helix-turn-helix domain-containing protein n=1 Tax=Luteibacter sp. RCC_6_2 TaxID=3239223 RepID=UPI003523DDCC